MGKRKTTEQFIADAVAVHGSKYDYSKVEYVKNDKKVTIICSEHGDFEQRPADHLREQGCPKCGAIRCNINQTINSLARKYKNIVQPEGYKLIPLTQGKFVKVDNEDFDMLKDINWYYQVGYGYNDKTGMMHRLIMNPPDDMVVDHINRDKLDNRRSNLRVCRQQDNTRNRGSQLNCSSAYKGVSRNKKDSVWECYIHVNDIKINLGSFKSEIRCAMNRDIYSLLYEREFAYLNFPELKEQYLKEIELCQLKIK